MPDITVEDIQEAGVVGAGGAGFPTHVKLAGKADTVLVNAAECEPLLHKDKEVLREYVDDVIEGTAIAMRLVGAARGAIGIKEKYLDVIDLLRSKLPKTIDVAPLRDAYPAGDEFILVYDVLGRVIPPGGIPLAVGAVVVNVETAMNVAHAAAASRHRKISDHRRRRGRAGHAAGARGRDAGPVRRRRRRTDRARRQLPGRRRDDGLPGREPRRPGRQDHRRGDRAARRARRGAPPPAGLAADRPHRPQRLRPVQFLHRACVRAGCWAIRSSRTGRCGAWSSI